MVSAQAMGRLRWCSSLHADGLTSKRVVSTAGRPPRHCMVTRAPAATHQSRVCDRQSQWWTQRSLSTARRPRAQGLAQRRGATRSTPSRQLVAPPRRRCASAWDQGERTPRTRALQPRSRVRRPTRPASSRGVGTSRRRGGWLGTLSIFHSLPLHRCVRPCVGLPSASLAAALRSCARIGVHSPPCARRPRRPP